MAFEKNELGNCFCEKMGFIKREDLKNASEEVIQVKLAERLHNMRTIDFIDELNDLGVKYCV